VTINPGGTVFSILIVLLAMVPESPGTVRIKRS
jgi:hypothetical protein